MVEESEAGSFLIGLVQHLQLQMHILLNQSLV